MRVILTAALAASLLGGTAVMAQPGEKNRDRGNQGEQSDRKDRKAEDRKGGTPPGQASGAPRALSTPQPAAPERAADTRQQGPRDRAPAPIGTNQPAPTAPERADTRQLAPRDRAPAPVQTNQPAPAAPVQPPRETYSGRGQADRMSVQQGPRPQFQGRSPAMTNNAAPSQDTRWSRGDRLPDQYRQDRYYVNDWQQYGLRQPPSGYRWIRNDNNDFYLSMIATGIISDAIYRSDRDERWRQRYSRYYSYNDDIYYQQCRRSPDPAGVILGGLIGGLLGNAAGHGSSGATIAGVIFGGAVGAALTSNMDCEDRSYAYKTYYNGFNSGRAGSHQWRNPRNDHRGEFRIGGYYNDPYGFRCARFTQVTYIQNRSYNANGVACRQPDGSWAVVN